MFYYRVANHECDKLYVNPPQFVFFFYISERGGWWSGLLDSPNIPGSVNASELKLYTIVVHFMFYVYHNNGCHSNKFFYEIVTNITKYRQMEVNRLKYLRINLELPFVSYQD